MPKLTKAVWTHRFTKMQAMMDDTRTDAIVFTGADFFQFATNFHTDVLPWERPIFAVVPRNGTPFLVMNELSTNHMRFSQEQGKVWITDVSFYAEHPRGPHHESAHRTDSSEPGHRARRSDRAHGVLGRQRARPRSLP